MATKSKIDEFVLLEELKSELQKFNNNFTEIFKQLEQVKHSIELVYNDRDLWKDYGAKIDGIKTLILEFDKHNETLTQDVKADVLETKNTVHKTSEGVKDVVEYNVGEIKEGLENKNIIKKKGFFNFLKKEVK